MTTLFASTALLPDGWADNVLIEIDKDGWIVGVDSFKPQPEKTEGMEMVDGPLVPGMPAVHAHAFQRAMAGLTERAGGRKKTFWNWRETLYRFLSVIGPEELEPIAAWACVEMLKGGYTSVGEFHYLHHGDDGAPYADAAIMSRQMIRAALETGIAITHMPVLYAYGGFGEAPPESGQKRFLNSVSSLMNIIEPLHAEFRAAQQVTIGLGHHSLRAVSPAMLREGTQAMHALDSAAPIHILASSHMAEVEACREWSGKRPVSWLLENAGADERWCFVHCTHISDEEMQALSSSGVVAGLCPTSEANLGSGVFPLAPYFAAGGRFAIGPGSCAGMNAMEELRWLEYVQRLIYQERTLISQEDLSSVGATLYERALSGGAQALGRKTGSIETGYRADFVVIDPDMPAMTGKWRDHILDTAIFAASDNPVRDVMCGGRWVVKNRRHKREEQFAENFRRVLRKTEVRI